MAGEAASGTASGVEAPRFIEFYSQEGLEVVLGIAATYLVEAQAYKELADVDPERAQAYADNSRSKQEKAELVGSVLDWVVPRENPWFPVIEGRAIQAREAAQASAVSGS